MEGLLEERDCGKQGSGRRGSIGKEIGEGDRNEDLDEITSRMLRWKQGKQGSNFPAQILLSTLGVGTLSCKKGVSTLSFCMET